MPRELEQYVDSTKEKQKNISDSLCLAYEYERKNLTQDYYSDFEEADNQIQM